MLLPDLARRLARLGALAAALTLSGAPARADVATTVAEDPVLEKRVTELAETLRCLVCQNQTIADSHADLAIDLRNQVREMMRAGRSDKQIIDYMVARYGEFVLYKPRVEGSTLLLWFGLALFAAGVGVLALKIRKRVRQAQAGESLSAEEHQRAAELLHEDEEGVA